MIKYLRRTTSGAAGIGLGTMITYLRGAAVIVLGKWRIYRLRSCKRSCKYMRTITASSLASRNFAMLSPRLGFFLLVLFFLLNRTERE
jgi:hypothetical protein